MTKNICDISSANENDLAGLFIDWSKFKADPHDFRLCWVKASEGDDPNYYPKKVYHRQMNGLRSVGIAPAPYHFFRAYVQGYGWCDAKKQAQAFFAQCDGDLGDAIWLIDVEGLSGAYSEFKSLCDFWDTPSANNAVKNAIRINNLLWDTIRYVEDLFKKQGAIYTAKWCWDIVFRLIWSYGSLGTGGPEAVSRYDQMVNYLADWLGEIDLPIGITHVDFHQYDTTPEPPGIQGVPTPYALDLGRCMHEDAWFNKFSGIHSELSDAEKVDRLWKAHPELWGKEIFDY